MTHIRGSDATTRLYLLQCTGPGCGAVHNPPLTSRTASAAREQARRDGWRAHNSPRRRKSQPDLCPTCRQETTTDA